MRSATVKSPLHKRPIPLITFSHSPLRRADRSSSEGVAATLLVEGGGREIAASLNLDKSKVNSFLHDEGKRIYGLRQASYT
jgi:hypothetical protein